MMTESAALMYIKATKTHMDKNGNPRCDTVGRLIVNIQDEEPDDELKHIARICGVTPGINRERYGCTPA